MTKTEKRDAYPRIPGEFLRNIGILTEEEQEKLMKAKVAVAGLGGVGGLHALTLARLGFGKFHLADPDIFERPNINRQYGAFASTLGQNKAEVIARMVRDIHPDAEVRTFTEGVNEKNAAQFLENVDVVLDGIEFFEFDVRRMLFKTALAEGIHVVTAAPLGFGASLLIFSPTGMSFDAYFGVTEKMSYAQKVAAFAVGIAPSPYHLRYLNFSRVNLGDRTGPALALACALASSLISAEVVKLITGNGKVKCVPHFQQIDLRTGKFRHGYVFMGGRNPIQILKRWVLLRKARSPGFS